MSLRPSFRFLTLLALTTCSGLAWADPVSTNAATGTQVSSGNTSASESYTPPANIGALGRAQSQVALLRAKLEIAKLQAEIAKVKSGKADNNSAQPKPLYGSGFPAGYSPFQQMDSVRQKQPKVLNIYGRGNGRDIAELSIPNGGTVVVRAGTEIAPYGRVSKVSGNGVYLVSPKGKTRLLPIASESSPSTMGNPSFPSIPTGSIGTPSLPEPVIPPSNISSAGAPAPIGMPPSMDVPPMAPKGE